MRIPATAPATAAFLVLSGCGFGWEDPPPPPPPFYSLEIVCQTCGALGLDTIAIHDASGKRVIALDSEGRASTSSTGESVQGDKTWFSARSSPLIVEGIHDSETVVWIDLIPGDWGAEPLQDTVLFRMVQDRLPDTLAWSASTRVHGSFETSGRFSFDYHWSQELRILPNEQGLFLLRVPKIVFRSGPPRSSDFFLSYRGMDFHQSSFPETFSMLSWPPRLDSSTRYSIWIDSWDETMTEGEVRSTSLHRDSSGKWAFHRVLLRGEDRLWEDSGSWDSTRGFVRALRRGPGLVPRRDSFAFRPLRVQNAINRVWWWDTPPFHGPALEKGIESSIRSRTWKYFAKP